VRSIFTRLGIVVVLLIGLTATALAAELDDGGGYSGSGTAYDNGVPFGITWTNSYGGYYTDYGTYLYVQSQRQGGCIINAQNYPFEQTVSGDVTYYWYGGHGSDITATYYPGICNSGDLNWGEGETTSGVVYWNSDPVGTGYVHVASQWFSSETFPNSFYESHNLVWH